MQFLKLYRKVRKTFVRPKLKLFIGKWKNEQNLPVWRQGNFIRLTKNYSDYKEVTEGDKTKYVWTEFGKQNHPVLSKLFVPCFNMSMWLSFYIFDDDIIYKYKWGEPRYEFPAHFCIVAFGLCFSITSYIDIKSESSSKSYDYWETLLTYLDNKGNIEFTNQDMGWWNTFSEDNNKKYRWRFRQEFLKKKEDKEELLRCQDEIQKRKNIKIS